MFAKTGNRPATKPTGRKTRRRSGPPKYLAIRDEVLRRHDVDKESLNRIAHEPGVCESTVRRSWDSAHTEEILAAAAEGRTPVRGGYRHLAAGKIKWMREMILMADGTSRKIAVAVGVSTITVQRERKRMLEGRNNRECALSVSATDRGPGGPGSLPSRGSHRPVRAGITAYGSSIDRFAIRDGPRGYPVE